MKKFKDYEKDYENLKIMKSKPRMADNFHEPNSF